MKLERHGIPTKCGLEFESVSSEWEGAGYSSGSSGCRHGMLLGLVTSHQLWEQPRAGAQCNWGSILHCEGRVPIFLPYYHEVREALVLKASTPGEFQSSVVS